MKQRKIQPSLRKRRNQRGASLVEMLAATVILGVGLVGLVASWTYMVRAAMISDHRSAGYEIARMVIERARANGAVINQPVMISAPASAYTAPLANAGSRSTWVSHSILRYRFYDATLEELGGGSNALQPPAAPLNAAFRTTTTVTISPDRPFLTAPAGRDDLRLVTISVVVHKINADGSVQADPVSTLQTCLTQGGLL
jgi:type II secretory pathway pseudopilin PulG